MGPKSNRPPSPERVPPSPGAGLRACRARLFHDLGVGENIERDVDVAPNPGERTALEVYGAPRDPDRGRKDERPPILTIQRDLDEGPAFVDGPPFPPVGVGRGDPAEHRSSLLVGDRPGPVPIGRGQNGVVGLAVLPSLYVADPAIVPLDLESADRRASPVDDVYLEASDSRRSLRSLCDSRTSFGRRTGLGLLRRRSGRGRGR